RLAMDDLVVVDDVCGHVRREVGQPAVVDGVEEALDDLLVVHCARPFSYGVRRPVVWLLRCKRSRGLMAQMSRERVLEAALDLVDQVGVRGLSMRKLGAALGVEAMTIYYYVPNRDAVLDGLVERVATSAFVVDPDAEWRSLLRDFASGFRRELLRHPGVLPL